jgi:hypothetical protein
MVLQATLRAMATVGIPEADREAILRTVAAILHLGNVQFIDGKTGDDSSQVGHPSGQLQHHPIPHMHACQSTCRHPPSGCNCSVIRKFMVGKRACDPCVLVQPLPWARTHAVGARSYGRSCFMLLYRQQPGGSGEGALQLEVFMGCDDALYLRALLACAPAAAHQHGTL